MGRGRGRAPCCEKVGLKKGPWTPAEDAKLIAYIQTHGHDNWRALPKLAGLLRCGKSCRLRWINYLRPGIKRGNFTKEEEETIFRLHKLMGNKWSKIASCLPGRTDNEIKNVWNTHLKKKVAPEEPTPPPPPPPPPLNKAKDPPSSPSGSTQPMEANNSLDMMSQLFMELDQCMLAEGDEYNLLVDDCRDSPSCSSLESRVTSCQELDDSENKQSSMAQIPAIPIDEEIWSLTDDDSYLPTPEVGPVVVEDGALNNPTISEGDSRRKLESKGWWACLERGADLGVTMDAEAVEQLCPWEFDGWGLGGVSSGLLLLSEETLPTFSYGSCISGRPTG